MAMVLGIAFGAAMTFSYLFERYVLLAVIFSAWVWFIIACFAGYV